MSGDMYMDAMRPCPKCGAERWAGEPHRCKMTIKIKPGYVSGSLDFPNLDRISFARINRWHKNGIEGWSVSDWGVAMAGEAGEICNAIKKMNRVRDDMPNLNEKGRTLETTEAAVAKIGEEIADTFLYLHSLALRLGLNMEAEIIKKFNSVSERYGFPERLP